jgi:hypothetical protein
MPRPTNAKPPAPPPVTPPGAITARRPERRCNIERPAKQSRIARTASPRSLRCFTGDSPLTDARVGPSPRRFLILPASEDLWILGFADRTTFPVNRRAVLRASKNQRLPRECCRERRHGLQFVHAVRCDRSQAASASEIELRSWMFNRQRLAKSREGLARSYRVGSTEE